MIPEPCVYILNAYDTYGDGWEGAEIDLYISGAFAGNYTLNGDFEENEILPYPERSWRNGLVLGIMTTRSTKFHDGGWNPVGLR